MVGEGRHWLGFTVQLETRLTLVLGSLHKLTTHSIHIPAKRRVTQRSFSVCDLLIELLHDGARVLAFPRVQQALHNSAHLPLDVFTVLEAARKHNIFQDGHLKELEQHVGQVAREVALVAALLDYHFQHVVLLLSHGGRDFFELFQISLVIVGLHDAEHVSNKLEEADEVFKLLLRRIQEAAVLLEEQVVFTVCYNFALRQLELLLEHFYWVVQLFFDTLHRAERLRLVYEKPDK